MVFPSVLLMLGFVALLYLAAYGAGAGLLLLARLRLPSAFERFGVACAVGAVVLGWLGFGASVAGSPLLAVVGAWVLAALGGVLLVRGALQGKKAEGVAGAPSRVARSVFRPCPESGEQPHGRQTDRATREHAAHGRQTDRATRQEAGMDRTDRLLLLGAVALGLLFAAGMSWGQFRLLPDGSLFSRFQWPDLLYRQAVVARLYNCDGFPQWPWLAGEAMKGMSLLRFAAVTPLLRAVGLPPDCYQIAALWLGLFGVPVAAGAAFALFRALGATSRVSAVAVLLTALLGKPRWLLAGDMAHSPALHWAGSDVFAIAVPVLLVTFALVALALRERRPGVTLLAVFLLVSGMGHVPWEGLAIYTGLLLWAAVALLTRRGRGTAVALAAGAVGGLMVLKVVLGTGGATGASPLAALAPSAPLRQLSWAFPFLAEPMRPLLAHLTPISLMKLLKFAAVVPVAGVFYLAGSLWVRLVLLADAPHWRWSALRRPEYGFAACCVVTGVVLSTIVDFRPISTDITGYNALRLLWPALLLANLGVALLAVRQAAWLRTRWGLLAVVVFVFYGSWENMQLVVWGHTGAPATIVAAPQAAALRYLAAHAGPEDTVLINPRYVPRPPPEGAPQPVTHAWGYVSGLLNAPVYLDNEDMARKFAQGGEWDRRWAELAPVLRSADAAQARAFLDRHGIRWVLLEGEEPLAGVLPEAGFAQAFSSGTVRVYQRQGS